MHPKFHPTRVRTHDLQILIAHIMSLRRLLEPLGHQLAYWNGQKKKIRGGQLRSLSIRFGPWTVNGCGMQYVFYLSWAGNMLPFLSTPLSSPTDQVSWLQPTTYTHGGIPLVAHTETSLLMYSINFDTKQHTQNSEVHFSAFVCSDEWRARGEARSLWNSSVNKRRNKLFLNCVC